MGSCHAITAPVEEEDEDSTSRARRAGFDTSRTACGVALVADYQYYSHASLGNSDFSTTLDKMAQSFSVGANLRLLTSGSSL